MYFYHVGKMNKNSSIGLIFIQLTISYKNKIPRWSGIFCLNLIGDFC